MTMHKTILSALLCLGFAPAATADECDAHYRGIGPTECSGALLQEYRQTIKRLFSNGMLNPKVHAVRGACDCFAHGAFVYCSANYSVHHCIADTAGNAWFSELPLVQGGNFRSWNTSSANPDQAMMEIRHSSTSNAANDLVRHIQAASDR